MTMAMPITTLFLDMDGVLLTNGWIRHIRIANLPWYSSFQLQYNL